MLEPSQNNRLMERLIGHQVRIGTMGGKYIFVDDGILESYDYPWLCLRTDKDEVLYFVVTNIRYIKAI